MDLREMSLLRSVKTLIENNGVLFFGLVPAALTVLAVVCWCGVSLGQSGEERLRRAREEKQEKVEAYFEKAGLSYPPYQLFLRIFKKQKKLEVWARAGRSSKFKLVKKYDVCKLSGVLGPKRKQGDLQVPEGFYHITGFNPHSKFHLSMRINYPNRSDKKLGDKNDPGDDIFIHGDCVTIGCVPIRDGPVKELYIMALDVKLQSHTRTHVHIFPCRMDGQECKKELERLSSENPLLKKFWSTLRPGYEHFEKKRVLPDINVGNDGYYEIAGD
ncbi:MAG: hypothetical protein R6V10_04620 [bacterium]